MSVAMETKTVPDPFGVVVVGIGIAGKVRIRDIGQCDSVEQLKSWVLKGFVSRRQLEFEGVKQITFEDALASPEVHAVIIATENDKHEQAARQSLTAGKHVLVDYPLALTAKAAQGLLQQASDKGLVCYEEQLVLLTQPYKDLKELLNQSAPLKEAEQHLKGSYNGWIEDFSKSGGPFTSSSSLFHAYLDLFGDLTAVEASVTRDENGYKAVGKLKTKEGKPLTLTIERMKGGQFRNKTVLFTLEDGTVIDKMPGAGERGKSKSGIGLFMQDLVVFMETVQGKRKTEYNDWITMRTLELAEDLQKLAGL